MPQVIITIAPDGQSKVAANDLAGSGGKENNR